MGGVPDFQMNKNFQDAIKSKDREVEALKRVRLMSCPLSYHLSFTHPSSLCMIRFSLRLVRKEVS